MRRDMKRVLIGRPRWKSSGKNYRRRELEDLIADWSPERLGMRRGHRDRKLVTDHVGPLRRFLRGRVGRPWNAVWAEVCSSADSRRLDGWHLREHVLMEVHFPHDGSPRRLVCARFYVDNAGILRLGEARQPSVGQQAERARDLVRVSRDLWYRRIDGCWFAFERGAPVRVRRWDPAKRSHTSQVRTVHKRQLGKRELRRLGLSNVPRGGAGA